MDLVLLLLLILPSTSVLPLRLFKLFLYSSVIAAVNDDDDDHADEYDFAPTLNTSVLVQF